MGRKDCLTVAQKAEGRGLLFCVWCLVVNLPFESPEQIVTATARHRAALNRR